MRPLKLFLGKAEREPQQEEKPVRLQNEGQIDTRIPVWPVADASEWPGGAADEPMDVVDATTGTERV